MKKKVLSIALAAAMTMTVLAGCGGSGGGQSQAPAQEEKKEEAAAPAAKEEAPAAEASGEKEKLEFYHGYFHAESEWPAAKVMRDIYDEFAAAHADGPVEFVPIPVENRAEITQNMISGGSFPDVTDLAGDSVPLAAISGGLIIDLKPYIDANGLKDAVGINYTQNDVGGKVYSVHDQLLTMGMWYNRDVLEAAGCSADDLKTWEGFEKVIDSVKGDNYAYIAGQSSVRFIIAKLAAAGAMDMITSEMNADIINSPEFASAFKEVAALDKKNGSAHTVNDVGQMMGQFNTEGKVAVLQNGVWNASGIDAALADVIMPCNLPGDVSIGYAGGGITIASGMSEEKEALALEFLAYMVSPEVQEKIFTGVQANPCNTTVDIMSIAKNSGDPIVEKLALACSTANSAKTIASNINWGGDVNSAIINALMECASENSDIDARFEQLQKELLAIVG